MEIKVIYEDKERVVKAVWYMGDFLYTITYLLNKDGTCKKAIAVYYDGTVSEQ